MSNDETVRVRAGDLDSAPVGTELQRADYLLLVILGIAIPVALLVWGWL